MKFAPKGEINYVIIGSGDGLTPMIAKLARHFFPSRNIYVRI